MRVSDSAPILWNFGFHLFFAPLLLRHLSHSIAGLLVAMNLYTSCPFSEPCKLVDQKKVPQFIFFSFLSFFLFAPNSVPLPLLNFLVSSHSIAHIELSLELRMISRTGADGAKSASRELSVSGLADVSKPELILCVACRTSLVPLALAIFVERVFVQSARSPCHLINAAASSAGDAEQKCGSPQNLALLLV